MSRKGVALSSLSKTGQEVARSLQTWTTEKSQLRCYDNPMSLPFEAKRVREYAFEFGAGGNRLGCKFLLDDGSLLFINESQITPEIEQFISSLGSPTIGLQHSMEDETIAVAEVVLRDFDGTKTIYTEKMPLPELISYGDTDEGILLRRRYAKTDQRDEHGRPIYVERN